MAQNVHVLYAMSINGTVIDQIQDQSINNGINEIVKASDGNVDPTVLLAELEPDLKDLLAAGLEVRIDQLDVTLPQGTLNTKFSFNLPETDRQSFVWTGVLLDLEATANIKIPEALYQFVTAMSPEANAAVAMGFLKKNGDVYEMAAQYKKGLLTVNGAPREAPLVQDTRQGEARREGEADVYWQSGWYGGRWGDRHHAHGWSGHRANGDFS